MLRRIFAGIVLSVAFSCASVASPHFPALTGRVVDGAQLLSAQAKASLVQLFADHEAATGNQVVAVTVNSLEGNAIEEYGVELGRHWKIGQKGKNNGVLLIVAPNEREVRIEVGYGLEGTLTDALSSTIIQSVILPKFKSGNMEQGIVDGAQSIVSVLGGQGIPQNLKAPVNNQIDIVPFIVIMAAFWIIMIFSVRRLSTGRVYQQSSGSIGNDYDNDGGSSDGGFSGGGGSFGGGGSSGKW